MPGPDDKATIARLTARAEELEETIRQLRESFVPVRAIEHDGLKLSPIEGAMLEALYRASPCVVDRRVLRRVADVASKHFDGEPRGDKTMDTAIYRIRQKLGGLTPPIGITTHYAAGYSLSTRDKALLMALRIEPKKANP
jgi:DNA-binding response OmpR family regulator